MRPAQVEKCHQRSVIQPYPSKSLVRAMSPCFRGGALSHRITPFDKQHYRDPASKDKTSDRCTLFCFRSKRAVDSGVNLFIRQAQYIMHAGSCPRYTTDRARWTNAMCYLNVRFLIGDSSLQRGLLPSIPSNLHQITLLVREADFLLFPEADSLAIALQSVQPQSQ